MKSINLQRTESLLMELVPEALSTLSDSRINSLAVTGVDCKNGKYDAKVILMEVIIIKKKLIKSYHF